MKKHELLILPAALKEIRDGRRYYELRRKGQGKKFKEAVYKAIAAITENPEHVAIRYDNVRCAEVHNYPYLIHYFIKAEEEKVYIATVYNTYRQPLWEDEEHH